MILSLLERMIRASPSSDPVSVLRTNAIRVPSGEILNAVTLLSVLQHHVVTSTGLSLVDIHIRCRPPWSPMAQISPYRVNCGLSRLLAALSNVVGALGSPPVSVHDAVSCDHQWSGQDRCSSPRRPVRRRGTPLAQRPLEGSAADLSVVVLLPD